MGKRYIFPKKQILLCGILSGQGAPKGIEIQIVPAEIAGTILLIA
jgi:hypothetical protein